MPSASHAADTARGEHLILYDGVCGLCNRFCQFVLAHDARGVFEFASLQSETGRSFLERFGRDPTELDTFGLVANYRSSPALLIKSAAALAVIESLGVPWRWLRVFNIVPAGVRDWSYDRVARHRYRIFGRYDTCLIPSPQQKRRFIDI